MKCHHTQRRRDSVVSKITEITNLQLLVDHPRHLSGHGLQRLLNGAGQQATGSRPGRAADVVQVWQQLREKQKNTRRTHVSTEVLQSLVQRAEKCVRLTKPFLIRGPPGRSRN